ncbi:MAG: patatin-like phospholipase family protein [Patescibacteria group bacterium]
MKNTKKIGLALSSGGIRGFALIGVLKALEENNISIDIISGASSGSIVAAHYALYKNSDLLKEAIIKNSIKLPSIWDLGFRGGLVKGNKLKKLTTEMFGKNKFSNTKIPLEIVATNLRDGGEYIFSKGEIAFSVQASCAVPVLFEPVKTKNQSFVDGGLSDPVPVKALKNMGADITIAVNLYHKNEFINRKFTVIKVALRSSRIAIYNLAQHSIREANIVIAPDLSEFTLDNKLKKHTSTLGIEKIIKVGYEETLKHIKDIKKLIK